MLVVGLLAFAGLAQAKTMIGTDGRHRLIGTPRADLLKGLEKADILVGRGGPDRLAGHRGADVLRGLAGRDRILGGQGPDRIIGGKGRDVLRGSLGRDEFNTSRTGLSAGGAGNDVIRARDRGVDLIDCGGGFDIVYVDLREDGVFNCEEIREPS